MKRKEDARLIRGLGDYCDDVRLPGMLHSAILRSPYAHARIRSIDTAAALAHPKVVAVVIAKDLEAIGLAWMPTISYDTQAVLAGDKVRFHLQEVAFVIATDPYAAQDALALIDIDYEVLPAIVNCRRALDPDAPVIRDDKIGQEDNLASPQWEAGDKANCDRIFAEADVVVTRDVVHPRVHPCPMETCGMVADMNPATGQLNIYNANQAPHAHRTVYAHVAGLAEQNIRILCNDAGGAFGNKVPSTPATSARSPGRSSPARRSSGSRTASRTSSSTGFARDYVHRAEICAKDGRITGLRVNTVADHGAFDATAQPTRVPRGVLSHRHRLLRPRGRALPGHAVYTNKAPGGVPIAARSGSPRPSTCSSGWSTRSR